MSPYDEFGTEMRPRERVARERLQKVVSQESLQRELIRTFLADHDDGDALSLSQAWHTETLPDVVEAPAARIQRLEQKIDQLSRQVRAQHELTRASIISEIRRAPDRVVGLASLIWVGSFGVSIILYYALGIVTVNPPVAWLGLGAAASLWVMVWVSQRSRGRRKEK